MNKRNSHQSFSYFNVVGVLLVCVGIGSFPKAVQATVACSACAPAANWVDSCQAGDDVLNLTWAQVGIDLNLDGVTEQRIMLSGPVTVRRAAPVGTNPATIATEIISMNLTGGGVTLRAGTQTSGINPAVLATTGLVTEQTGDNTKADSSFNVFFQVDLGGGVVLYNHNALQVAATISCDPPSVTYAKVGTQAISLFTTPTAGTEQARVNTVYHSTIDQIPTGACCRDNNRCDVGLTQAECQAISGFYEGDGTTTCRHAADGRCIPTLSAWGVAVMTLLVLTAATIVLIRRRNAQPA